MCDCARLRERLTSLPRCCAHCEDGAHPALVDGEPMGLCCHVLCSLLTHYAVEFGADGETTSVDTGRAFLLTG